MVEADLDYVTTIERPAAAKRFIGDWNKAQHKQALHEPGRLHLIIESIPDGEPIGFNLLAAIDSADKDIEFHRIVVHPQGQCLGRQTIRLLKRYVFDELGARRLWLDVEPFNERAYSLYRSEGFEEVDDPEENAAASAAIDSLIIMAILRDHSSTNGLVERSHP